MLRVDPVHVDVMRVFERGQRGFLGDFVELDPLRIVELQQLGQMPGDRLALAVGVGREVDVGCALYRAAQLLDDVALAFDRQILGREIVLDVNAQRAFWKVAHVPDRRLHGESRRKKLLDRPRLRRRLHDDQGLFHGP